MQAIDNPSGSESLRLTPQQQRVLEALIDRETEEYPLSRWYLGAFYALNNEQNPDRIPQAAHSLRELLEKLPRVVEGTDAPATSPNFQQKRAKIYKRILKDKENYPDGWENKQIDGHLDKTFKQVEEYLESNWQPTRRERMQMAVTTIDPMANRFDIEIRERKRDELHGLWEQLEGFAHHKSKRNIGKFEKCLDKLEKTVTDLLAPITAQNQKEIQTILGNANRSKADVENMFSLIESRGANYVFFFKHAADNSDITWLSYLDDRHYFDNPPNAEPIGEGIANYPFWWPMRYLARMARHAQDDVIEIVLRLPKTDNPWIYNEIVEIALQLPGTHSAKLEPKILEYANLEYHFLAYRFADLLAYWTRENQTTAALNLTNALVKFVSDPEDEAKRKRRGENPKDSAEIATLVAETQLNPSPRIDDTEYLSILSEGVCPLAEKKPFRVAYILINATANMIILRTHQEDLLNGIDYSESWCDRLTESEGDYEDAEKSLIQTLTFACVQVYEKLPQLVSELDRTLREQQLRAFKRLRYHLCAQHPNETTKPWIQQLIREHKGYDWLQHGYEFQRMVRRACEHFGNTLVTKEECIRIFDSILDGPSETNHRVWVEDFLDEEFTEDRFIIHTRRFHRMQLRPFECVLFGKYATYFRDLEHEAGTSISDEDYGPRRIQTSYGPNDHSPIAHDDLANYDDEELLHYINDWDNPEVFYDGKKYMRINVEGLSQAFETIFKKSIIPNSSRLMFWMGNLEMVERPIFLERMLAAMRERIETNNLDKLNDWLVFCNRVLLHTEHQMANDRKQADESSEVPEWYSLRWTVGDFIRVCLDRDTDMPVSAQEQLGNLLDTLCTQFDWYLDRETTLNRLQTDLADTGINNPRGKALKDLINFGFWLRRHKLDSESRGVTKILEKRFATDSQYSLTLPEYAILGMSYSQILSLDRKWAIRNKSNFFPKDARSQWLAAFGSYVDYNRASEPAFEILREEYSFALQLLDDFNKQHRTEDIPTGIFDGGTRENNPEEKLMSILGRHFFIYYLWEMYPLKGKSSLLERYYRVTDGNRERWGDLFEWVGRTLRDTSQQLEQNLIDRIIDYFDWRLQVKEPVELKQFNSWLEAKCLAAHWRLDACAKVLEVCKTKGVSIILPIDALCEMLPDCTAKVVACFARLTDDIGDDNIYIYTDEAITILSAGLGSSDHDVLQNAERAPENLLRIGRFDLMELGD